MSLIFDVLDRHLPLHQNYLLEASAGTGKTFCIENIVTRLLIDPKPLTIDQILVVTFTKLATRELKVRIRTTILKTLDWINDPLQEHLPDYLIHALEQNEDHAVRIKKLLEQALFCFDQAQIFTIHGFCHRMLCHFPLEGDYKEQNLQKETTLSFEHLSTIIHNFFRTELTCERYHRIQIKILLKHYRQDIAKLMQDLVLSATKGEQIAKSSSWQELVQHFLEARDLLKKRGFCAQKILADYAILKEVCNMRGKNKEKDQVMLAQVANLFAEQDASEGLGHLVEGLGETLIKKWPTKIKKGLANPCLHLPHFLADFTHYLWPIIKKAGEVKRIFAQLAYDVQSYLKRYLDREELSNYDGLLKKMQLGLQQPLFVEEVRKRYKAAIIDEFQDTDPTQWDIFYTLFLKDTKEHALYLVGDPKQSIYAFRRADIYTYLKASQALGQTSLASLTTNFRSSPRLVSALNALFNPTLIPSFIYLPQLKSELPYQAVQASAKIEPHVFKDSLESIHFFTAQLDTYSQKKAETTYFFPFIVQEIQRLRKEEGFTAQQIAILVSDRLQAARLTEFLKAWQIPLSNQRQALVKECSSVLAFQELLQAILNPRQISTIKIALGGAIIGWTHQEIKKLSQMEELEKVVLQFSQLNQLLWQTSFSVFFQQLLNSSFSPDQRTLTEHLLARQQGLEFYQALLLLGEQLAREENASHFSPPLLLKKLDAILQCIDEEEALKQRPDSDKEAIQILTIHNSKGLEFEVVFPLGLISRHESREALFPKSNCLGKQEWHAITEEDPAYQLHSEELEAEKMRQFYVALTRAKHRVYLPVLFCADGKGPLLGSASPMELYCAKLGHSLSSREEMYERLKNQTGEEFYHCLEQLKEKEAISYCKLQEDRVVMTLEHTASMPILQAPPIIHIKEKKEYTYSFTSLSSTSFASTSFASTTFGQQSPLLVESWQKAPQDFEIAVKNCHTLPAGNETGLLLHKILEEMQFHQFAAASALEKLQHMLTPYVIHTVYKEWQPTLALLLFNALQLPLNLKQHRVCLSQLDPLKMYKETSFLYPWKGSFNFDECENLPGYLKGVIDLIFEYEGYYYLVDWKSNWLGSSQEDYHAEAMQLAMENNHYFLQATIYTEACRRYLNLFDPRPFEDLFGGIFYIFLRGVDPLIPQQGVFYFNPLQENATHVLSTL